ncbi:MAG: MFS transporter, partial [Vicinamibacterales bacterium]
VGTGWDQHRYGPARPPDNGGTMTATTRAFPALLLCAFFGAATYTSVTPFLNEMSADLAISAGLTGQLTSVSSLAAAVVSLALAPFVAAWAPKPLLTGTVAIIGVASIGSGLAPSFPALLALQFVVGGASAVGATSTLVALGRVYRDPTARAARQGLVVGALGSGALLGTPILRLIADAGSWRVALTAYGLAALLAATVASLTLPAMPAERRGTTDRTARIDQALAAARLPGIGTTLATSALTLLVWGVLSAFLAGAFVDRYPGREGWIGALWFTDGFAWLIGCSLGGLLVARVAATERVLAGSLAAMTLAMAAFAWLAAGPLVTLVSFGVWALLFGVASNAVLTLYTRHAGAHGPAVLFLDSAIQKVAMFLGGVSGGIAIDLSGGYAAWSALAVAASSLALLPLALRMRATSIPRYPAIADEPAAP